MLELYKKIDNGFQSVDGYLERFRLLSGNAIKMIAIMTMLVDHFSKIVLAWIMNNVWCPLYLNGQMPWEQFQQIDNFIRFTLYGIGTIAFPLFCFLITEGFHYTKNRKRYCFLMLIFAIVSEIPFDIAFFSSFAISEGTYPFYWGYQNIFFTLFFGIIALWCIEKFRCQSNINAEKIKSTLLQIISVAALAGGASLIHTDYGGLGVLFIVAFYLCRTNRLYQIVVFLATYMLTTGNQPTLFIGIACLIILLYNGKRGKLHLKYFFYVFYPAHIAVLYLITVWLATAIK